MTTIIYTCPNCGRGRRSPGLCPSCHDQARDEITSIMPGLAWIARLVWWQFREVCRDVYQFIAREVFPAVWGERIGIMLFVGGFVLLAVAMFWMTAR